MDLRGNSQIGDRMQITEVQIHGTAHTYLLVELLKEELFTWLILFFIGLIPKIHSMTGSLSRDVSMRD